MDFETIEATPKPKGFTCKLYVWGLAIFIYAFPFVLGIVGVIYFGWFIGFCFLCLGYLINGVIQSKLRQLSLPLDQIETSFSTYEISCWFVDRYLMCEKLNLK